MRRLRMNRLMNNRRHQLNKMLGLPLFVAVLAMPAFVLKTEAQPFIPPNANAGMIQNHHLNQMFINKNMPWTNRPITEEDFKPPESLETEPLIQFMHADTQGMIILKNSETGGVRIQTATPQPTADENGVNNHNYQTLPPLRWDTDGDDAQ